MRRRLVVAVALVAVALAAWTLRRTPRRGVEPERPATAEGGLADPAPSELAVAPRARRGLGDPAGRPAGVGGDAGASRDASSEIADDFPAVALATLEIELEPDPHVADPTSLLAPTFVLSSPNARWRRSETMVRARDALHWTAVIEGAPIGRSRLEAGAALGLGRMDGLAWGPVAFDVVAPTTTVRLALDRGPAGLTRVRVRAGDAPISAMVDVYDGEFRIGSGESTPDAPMAWTSSGGEELTFRVVQFTGARGASALPAVARRAVAGGVDDVVMDVPAASRVRLRVVARDGSAIAGANCIVVRTLGPGAPTTVADATSGADGLCPCDLLPGSYVARVAAAVGRTTGSARFEVTPTSATELDVVLDAAPSTRVRVLDADGAPCRDVPVWVGLIDAADPLRTAVGSGKTDDDGVVALPALEPQAYRFAISQMLSVPVEIGRGTDVISLAMPTPHAGDASVSATVIGPTGMPMRTAFLWLERDGDVWAPYASISDGTATVPGLVAGAWRVHVMSSWYFSEPVAPFEGRVVLREGERREIEIRLKAR